MVLAAIGLRVLHGARLSDALRDLHSRRERGLIPPRPPASSSRAPDLQIRFPNLVDAEVLDPVLRHHFRAGSVVTTVEVVNGLSQLDASWRIHPAGRDRRPPRHHEDGPLRRRRGPCPPAVAPERAQSGTRSAPLPRRRTRRAEILFGEDTARRAAGLCRRAATAMLPCRRLGRTVRRCTRRSRLRPRRDEPIDWTGFGVWPARANRPRQGAPGGHSGA